MSITTAGYEDEGPDFELGRAPRETFTMVPDWVTFHQKLSPQAKALYSVLLAHVNNARRESGDTRTWPTETSIARALKFKLPKSIRPYVTELEDQDAITVRRGRSATNRMRKRNTYVIHILPKEDYDGPRSLAEFYRMQED